MSFVILQTLTTSSESRYIGTCHVDNLSRQVKTGNSTSCLSVSADRRNAKNPNATDTPTAAQIAVRQPFTGYCSGYERRGG